VGGVFINYRGEDSDTAAVLIDRELTSRFGDDRVFLDSRSIPVGVDFVDELLGRLRGCSVLLVVIGPRWLTLADAAGARLVDDPRDWIRREIVEALTHGLRVIPVLTGDVRLPAEEDLPDDIAGLSRRQYVHLRRRYASADLAFLVNRIIDTDPELAEVARRLSSTERMAHDEETTVVSPAEKAPTGLAPDLAPPGTPGTTTPRAQPPNATLAGPARVTQRRSRRRRLAYAALVAVLVAAGVAAVLTSLVHSTSPSDEEGPPSRHFTAASPWRLVVHNKIVGTNNGCTVTVTNIDTKVPKSLTNIYGTKQFQFQDTGSFRWEANNPGCLVIQQADPGEAVLPFAQRCCGDTDAFTAPNAPSKIVVQIRDFNGNTRCDVLLRDAADGRELDFGSVRQGGGSLSLDPRGRSQVYLANLVCGIWVSADG
jgi:TIR domain